MSILESEQAFVKLPDDVQVVMLAFSALAARVGALPEADRNDLLDLVLSLRQATDQEERDYVKAAALEILMRDPIRWERLPADDEPLPTDDRAWAVAVGERVRTLREQAGLTPALLATAAGIPEEHLKRLENADLTASRLTLTKLARALTTSVAQLDPDFAD